MHLDQEASFTVDAHPGWTFKGTVTQIQKKATMQQNVVTYNVVVSTENKNDDHPEVDEPLLPYMTANLKFIMEKKTKVLMVPNSALRYKPSPEIVAPDIRDKYARRLKTGPRGANEPSASSASGDGA